MKLDAASTRKPNRPRHMRFSRMSAAPDPMSEQHQLLKDGIKQDLLDEVDDDDDDDDDESVHERAYQYDEHTVMVATS